MHVWKLYESNYEMEVQERWDDDEYRIPEVTLYN